MQRIRFSSRIVSHACTASVLALALATSGCGTVGGLFKSSPETPKTGSLTQQFSIMDREGRTYGVLELDPISGGKVTDAQGRIIGYVVPPTAVAQPAAALAPVAPAAPAPVAVEPLPGVPTATTRY